MIRNMFRANLALIALAMPSAAWAHPGHEVQGLVDGLLHPLTGIDHLAAMLFTGMVATLLVRCDRWVVPASFTAGLASGFAASSAVSGGAVELFILLSLLSAGLVLLLRLPMTFALALFAPAIFGFAHGAAHGIDMPGNAAATLFATGFLAMSIGLQGAGFWMARLMPVAASRAAGTAGVGLGLLLAVAA